MVFLAVMVGKKSTRPGHPLVLTTSCQLAYSHN